MARTFSRRQFLHVSLGASVSLAQIGLSCASDTGNQTYPLILVFLSGGPSSKETFNPDPPNSPVEFRGSSRSIPTSIPGIHFSEYWPLLAQRADKFCLLRGLDAGTDNHQLAAENITIDNNTSLGEVVGGRSSDGVPYAMLNPGRNYPSVQTAFHQSNSFCPIYDEETKTFIPPRMPVVNNLQERRDLLNQLDTPVNSPQASRIDRFRNTAFDLMSGGGSFFQAFNVPYIEKVRYGKTLTGDMLVLAKRLVERGAGAVTVYHELTGGAWDHHTDLFTKMRSQAPEMDLALANLIDEIDSERLRCVLMIMGEFSRTPRVNENGGRDHWQQGNCAILCGGRFRKGVVYGRANYYGQITNERILQRQVLGNTVQEGCGLGIPPASVRVREILI